ncbi:hypothetical protein BS47DRAFT_164493 [Hydnum rufescens UP504]|uniref:UBA domain-containing protein n=1 Tax=Hydnum rufescens UP504 TaxID=1448309 RepID=A0A9P6B9U5_9AGAM|nr:hypothetical protein BS47DRAFT_164493 [Hydnum rufescens UP504]
MASVVAASAFADASLSDPSPSAATLPPPPSVSRRLSQSRRGTSPFPFVSTSPSSPSKPISIGASLFDNASFTESRFPALDNPVKALQNPELDAAFWGPKAPPTGSAQDGNLASETFAFKSSFDDTFDFNSASAFQAPAVEQSNGNSSGPEPAPKSFGSAMPLTTPSPSTIPRPSNPFPGVPTTREVSTSFDAVFNMPPAAQEVGAHPPSSYQPLSFDDAFGSAPALPAFNVSSNQAPSTPSDASPSPAPPLPVRPRESPAQQRTTPSLTDSGFRRSTSPRPQSPVFNSKASAASPPLPNRKDSTEPPASASRTSKLSLHFPFGKSKKEKKVASAAKKSTSVDENISSPQSLSGFARAPSPSVVPVPADAIGTAGPNEDVDAVKTLVGMGFSREQAVQALERHSYDVSTALNSLLGTV